MLYVDDILLTSSSKDEINKLKYEFRSEFKMNEFREANMILGM